jgi:site-specific DNA recombinase
MIKAAYQEDLVSLDELRSRMPDLRRCEQGMRAELKSITDQIADNTEYLRLAETLTAFLQRLRMNANTLDVIERQRIVRLLVKEVLSVDARSLFAIQSQSTTQWGIDIAFIGW